MPDSDPIPTTPNFVPGVGRLVTDRYDFENHVLGTAFRHTAGNIDLSPSLVIGGTTYTDVQSAIAAINALAEPPVITSATIGITTANLGVITLGGDVGNTALVPRVTGLQGRSVLNVPPAVGNVLKWGGTSWGPAAESAFTASGDLGGNNISQRVISITGAAGVVSIASTGAALTWTSTTPTPSITQTIPGSGVGQNMSMIAQAGSAGNQGGSLILSSGAGTAPGGSVGNGVAIQLGGLGNLMEATYLSTSNRVLSLVRPGALTTSQMPVNTGDLVVYVGNAATIPTALPSNGAILWATGNQLWTMDDSGNTFKIGSGHANPDIFGNLSLTSGQVITFLDFATTTTNSAALVRSYLTTDGYTAIYVDCEFIAKGVGQTDGAAWTSRNAFLVGNTGVITTIGTNTFPDARSAGDPSFTTSLTAPVITFSGSSILINTGFAQHSYAHPVSWVVTTKFTIVKTS